MASYGIHSSYSNAVPLFVAIDAVVVAQGKEHCAVDKQIYKMRVMIGLSLMITAALMAPTTAFAPTSSSFAITNGIRPTSTAIHMMDPSHLFDSASSLLLSDTAPSVPEAGGVSYSKASYYTVLALYLMSFPGLWSQIKRSTAAKVKRKTYVR